MGDYFIAKVYKNNKLKNTYIIKKINMKKILGIILLVIMLASCSDQDEKQRDSSRIATLKSVQASLESSFSDNLEYPDDFTFNNSDYKDWEIINWCTFWYKYEVFEKYSIPNSWYRLSTCLESSSNKDKLTSDWWIYDDKYELWEF